MRLKLIRDGSVVQEIEYTFDMLATQQQSEEEG